MRVALEVTALLLICARGVAFPFQVPLAGMQMYPYSTFYGSWPQHMGHGTRPASIDADAAATISDYLQWTGRKMHDAFSPPYSWMMQLGLDAYGLNHPWAFNYWNLPEKISKFTSLFMEPSEEEKAQMAKEGRPYEHTPTKAAFNAAAALVAGKDPVQTFVSTLSPTDPLRLVTAVATGKAPVDPAALLSVASGMSPQQLSQSLINGAQGPFKSMFSTLLNHAGPMIRDPLTMAVGVALPQESAKIIYAPKPEPPQVDQVPPSGDIPLDKPAMSSPSINMNALKSAFNDVAPNVAAADDPLSHVVASASGHGAEVNDLLSHNGLIQQAVEKKDAFANLLSGLSGLVTSSPAHTDPLKLLSAALAAVPSPFDKTHADPTANAALPETKDPALTTLKSVLDTM